MYSKAEQKATGLRLKTEFALQIFTDLLGFEPKNGKKYKFLDTSPTNNDTFYLNRNSKPLIHNFSSGKKLNAIDAYKEKKGITFEQAFKDLCDMYINNIEPANRQTYTPAMTTQVKQVIPANPLEITIKDFEDSISNRHKSNFVSFLRKIFTTDIVKQVLKMYDAGNIVIDNPNDKFWNKFDTAFWYRDANNKLLTAKYFAYDKENGKRSKIVAPNWLHSQKRKDNPKIGFFGEHLLKDTSKPVAIVESEKTAIIASVCYPKYIWLASGGLSGLTLDKCLILRDRVVILYPDTGKPNANTKKTPFEEWTAKIEDFSKKAAGFSKFEVRDFLEKIITQTQKEQGFDMADYFIQEITKSKITPPAINEVTKLSYQSYSDLFANFDKTLNFGAKVDISIFEQNPTIDLELDTLFNSSDFGKNVEFNVYEVFDVLTQLEKTVNLIHQPQFITTLQVGNETAQIPCK